MRQSYQYFYIFISCLFLMACGSGNELSDGSGGGGTDPNPSAVVLSIALVDDSGNTISNVDGQSPGNIVVSATLNDEPVQGKKVNLQLTDEIGELLITSALTDSSGVATVKLYAGQTAGAGTVTATADDVSTSLDFSTSNPDSVVVSPLKLTLSLQDKTTGAVVTNVDGKEAVSLTATFLDNDQPVTGTKVSFSLLDNVGSLTVTTALTDSNGVAQVDLFAGLNAGAGTVSATINETTATLDFSVSNPVVVSPTQLTLALVNKTSGATVTNVDGAEAVNLTATYLEDGVAVAGAKMTFALLDNVGLLTVTTALTDSSGVATVDLFAGPNAGAGTVIATVGEASSSLDFSVSNPVVVSPSQIDIVLLDDVNNVVTNVDGSNPVNVRATYSVNGEVVPTKKVTFALADNVGQILVFNALTNTQGIASIKLFAGDVSGAGTIFASVGSTSASLDFSVTNPVAISPIDLKLGLIDQDGNATLNVSSANPATLQATLTQSGEPSAGVKVIFSLADEIGELKTTTALTNSDGIASVVLFAGANQGAGTATAVINNLSSALDFSVSVSAVNVTMDAIALTPSSISANGTATVAATINETGIDGVITPLAQSVDVQFTSICAQQGKAELDTDVATINGVAISTYKDNGCGDTDTIFVTTTIGQTLLSQSADLTVAAAGLSSIQFKSATPTTIALRGTGGAGRSETSRVTFTVRDEIGNPVADALVDFELTTSVGGITMLPSAPSQAKTDSNGDVDVVVQAGNVATPVRVIAKLNAQPIISTISGELSISTGVADYNSLSLSASELNPEAWTIDGVEVDVTARLADHFNNPVPDGTTINFTTEYGAIDPTCSTENGVCSVKWKSQSPKRPSPDYRDPLAITRILGSATCYDSSGTATGLSLAGLPCFYNNTKSNDNAYSNRFGGLGQVYGNRVTIFAHVIGEESFADSNGNGRFDDGEAFTDLTEAFRDDNEDSLFGGRLADGSVITGASDASPDRSSPTTGACYNSPSNECFEPGGDNEEFIDFNINQQFDKENGIYNGVLCSDEDNDSGLCSKELVTISKNITILQAGTGANIGMIEAGLDRKVPGNYFNTVDISTSSKTVIAYVSDLHNGLLPVGTTIEFTAGNGEIVGPNSCIVANSSAFAIAGCSATVKADDESDSGILVVAVTVPSGAVSTASVSLID
ncbi:hypothetical protein [Psychrobium sp. 1_MG-2023]|uniref:beta strand repeat-containing protein n=1 Tax=Psychrobium sp. 1_MG-2023 TaxID=3062624 RepID=UPI000C34F7B0|nr:hypothetical protein [Psychrobium sp. 1_MG-2023]MDP2560205.1 hypothetical protein [Psychrobium sp. 1_MG-2023]PKF57016.1 hypothetical protein CW748_07930 [Alteromonadales bacterium alter-6D02]